MALKFWIVLLVSACSAVAILGLEKEDLETDRGTVHEETDSDSDCQQWMSNTATYADGTYQVTITEFVEGLVMRTASDSQICYLRDITDKDLEDRGNCGSQLVSETANVTNSTEEATDYIPVTDGVSHVNLTDRMASHCTNKTVIYLQEPAADGDDGDVGREKRWLFRCRYYVVCYYWYTHRCRRYSWFGRYCWVTRYNYRCYWRRICFFG